MKKIFETGVILFATFGFWGMIYPDLCFTEEVCRVIVCDDINGIDELNKNDDADVKNNAEYDGNSEHNNSMNNGSTGSGISQKDIYTRICEAQPDEIVIKSKLLDVLGIGKKKANTSVKESKGITNVKNKFGEESGSGRSPGGGI